MNLFGFLGHYPWLGYLSGALQLIFLVHAITTRRPTYWFFILLFGSYIGVLAYLFLEVLPGMRGNARRVSSTLQPALENLRPLESRIREVRERTEESDTLQNRADLAALLARAGREDEAQGVLEPLLTGIYADDPLVLLTSAELSMARCDPAAAAAHLKRVDLKTSASIRTRTLTLLAQAQAEQTLNSEAEATYQQALIGATSEEPRVRYAAFLIAQNRSADAKRELDIVAKTEQRASRLYKGQEREWFSMAGKLRRELN
ncbi:hypothetical protein EHF33_03335 [Deinococcus psychrotolerans]|uniref:Tetratricopeptide repeat protein n=1 Tax=Deinococcus psychrotolerans TaxID=2489213 RepID=A0A3G8Y956_9DEIO|nr:hypothetical protein [Deinococcus psychrotolerans]AZI41902.1 hypothetical protein EHF33_03335 [Deinococcus psychrotolerans]